MPNPNKVRRAWGLPEQGEIIDNYKVEKASIGHIQKIRYRKYAYPIDYELEGTGNLSELESIFQKGKKAVVYTSYGNPYDCTIQNIQITKEGNKVHIVGNGICIRDFNLPKRKE